MGRCRIASAAVWILSATLWCEDMRAEQPSTAGVELDEPAGVASRHAYAEILFGR